MFKSARWRSEKNKVKSVFKLQFHATQVSQLSVDSLTLSVIPVDIGKPSVKLEKASVKDGGCRWENPVHETVRFFREPRTGKIAEKIYRFSVANGSTKNGVLGEVSIDFAAYAEATKASTVALPLKGLNSEAILHVMIQRLQENVDQREFEECDDIKPKNQDKSLKTHLSNGHIDELLAVDGPISKTTNHNGPIRKTANHNGELNGNHRASSGSDITFSSSDSSSGVNTPREHGLRNGDAHQEPPNYLSSLSNCSMPQKKVEHALMTNNDHRRSQWEWSGGSERGTDDSTQSSRSNLMRESSLPDSDSEIDKLKAELGNLARQANMSELELQTLRRQIIKESKRGVDLSREVACLKEEREAYKAECERLKSFQARTDDAKANKRSSLGDGDLRTLVEEIRQELNHEKDLNSNLKLQLQKTQEANAELLLAIQDLEEIMEQKNKEIADPTNQSGSSEDAMKPMESIGKCDSDEDEEQKALEKLVKEHRDANETLMLEQKITDLYNEIEIYRRDRDEFEMQMEQLALDYEILKQENHDISYKLEQSQIQEQLKMQYECSPINELTSHIESLEKLLKEKSEELESSSTTIKELEFHIKSLGEELETNSKEKAESLVRLKELESRVTSLNEELKMREKQSSDSSMTIKELNSHITSLNEELKMKAKESSDYAVTIKDLESHIDNLDEELKRRSKEHFNALETIKELKSHIKSIEEELKMRSEEVSESSVTVKGLESRIEALDGELKKRSKESSDSLATIRELEFHIKGLEEEFEERQHEFETDLEALMVAKVEQEQRAIRAEESLRRMRWKNAGTAEKLQEEFRRLSTQMSSTFEANEKVAMKSIQEASELRVQKVQLEEMLRKAKAELQVVKDEYEAKLRAFTSHKDENTKQIEHQKREGEIAETLSREISHLKAEIERLQTVNSCITQQAEDNGSLILELEKLKKSVKENEVLIEKGNKERNELMNNIVLEKKEAELSLEELNRIKNLKDDKEATATRLQSELEKLRAQCDALKNSLTEDEVEKEKLRKQVFQLKNELKKKDDAIANIEKKLKNSDGTKASPKNTKPVAAVPRGPKDVIILREKIKLLEGQIKSKEASLEISAATFLEKEKDLHNKIEELESQVEELSRSSEIQKIVKDASTLTSNDDMSSMKRDENETPSLDNNDSKLEDLATELALLEEKNRSMEGELKEMQERYSEISLKFAEVEGERQKLVMTVRYLKNNRKN